LRVADDFGVLREGVRAADQILEPAGFHELHGGAVEIDRSVVEDVDGGGARGRRHQPSGLHGSCRYGRAPSAQATANHSAASGRLDHRAYSSMARSKASSSTRRMEIIASRAVRTTPAMFEASTGKVSIPAQPPKKIHVLRTGFAPASWRSCTSRRPTKGSLPM